MPKMVKNIYTTDYASLEYVFKSSSTYLDHLLFIPPENIRKPLFF